MLKLDKHPKFKKRQGPVVLIIMDGVGLGMDYEGNAFINSRTPQLNNLMKSAPFTSLQAHGTAVGLPSDEDMGNSEVGHNAIGAGRVFDQGAKRVEAALASGDIYTTEVWKELIEKPLTQGTALHFLGLFSDGNVHSNISHLVQMLNRAAAEGIKKARIHILLDGRDVPETSALEYIDKFEEELSKINSKGFDYRIASGGGRMITTMDRYEADWSIVERGWQAHVLGEARHFSSAKEAVETYRKEQPGITDQYLNSFTIAENNEPIGPVIDGDSVIFFNFRGDRSIEISAAFEKEIFDKFDRKRFPKVTYAGMMEYDGDLHVPKKYLVQPPAINNPVSEYLAAEKCRQYAISETQKFGHVTYFWNGNKSGKFDESTETYKEVPSDKIEFDRKPWMKAAEITEEVLSAIESGSYDFIRLNFANGDMVGHTGNMEAAVIAMETVDLMLSRILPAVKKANGVAMITADHGNLDEMFEADKNGVIKKDKKTGEKARKTSHTLNPVPFIIYDPLFNGEYEIDSSITNGGLGNIAATILSMLGYEKPADYLPSLIKFK
ncbi:MAG: 2,3-bisphosphoglycerate-independent phosphoglycerate mutase [Spirochaetes bacterium]|nr:2,3-bisphosphoglycerate-independent phosphoglycerate mutase [Spirochaetota bacterium]